MLCDVSWALKAVSELRFWKPRESNVGIKDRRERAMFDVFWSPIPSRSLRPPYDDPSGTMYVLGMKCSGFKGCFQ